jgi:predicted outer membrane repeat protein
MCAMMLLLLLACNGTTPAKSPVSPEDSVPEDTGTPCTPRTWYADSDADGIGSDEATEACDAPEGFVAETGDCDDADPLRSPANAEVCDLDDVDEDCSGAADDADPGLSDAATWYRDYDRDGYATGADATIIQCDAPTGYTSVLGDCDDADAGVNPSATEVCDPEDVDEDCDGLADDADPDVDTGGFATLYADEDADGFGQPNPSASGCDAREGLVTDATDCDDASAAVNPGATEICNEIDDDCDGLMDDADASLDAAWYHDGDFDGYGDERMIADGCEAPAGHVALGGDCDDADEAIHPGAEEICLDSVDQDCDGFADEYTGTCAPADVGDADLCDPAVVPADASLCDEGIAAVLETGESFFTVQAALGAAVAGDVVTVCPGAWRESLDAGTTTPLGIVGYGADVSVIAPSTGSALVVGDGVELTLVGVTIEGASDTSSGGLALGSDGSTFICASAFGLNASGGEGGAIQANHGGDLTIDATLFYANSANSDGGALRHQGGGSVVVEDSAFVSSSASNWGGAVNADGADSLTVRRTSFEGGTCAYGGAIYFTGDLLDVEESEFDENACTQNGGAIYLSHTDGTLDATIDRCTFTGNTATGYGGAIRLHQVDTGTLTIRGSTFADNRANTNGGHLGDLSYSGWTVDISDSSFTGGYATWGGGAFYFSSGTETRLTLTDSTITSNETDGRPGGAVYIESGSDTTLTSVTSDWGSGDDDNAPDDVNGYRYGDDASFACDDATCE